MRILQNKPKFASSGRSSYSKDKNIKAVMKSPRHLANAKSNKMSGNMK
jgi:hypothetical protein